MAQPNIVLIVSDQHRADWLGCAGNRVVRTPNLDALAAGGVRFTDAYCNAPLCVPSRMSMLAGRQPHRTGVLSNGDSLPSGMPTFAHALALAGYETVLCGRMHFVGTDQRHGYGRRLVGDITPSYPGGPQTDYGALAGTAGQGRRSIEHAGPGDSPVQRYDEAVVRAGERFLQERATGSADRPLFLTVGLYGPHHPFIAPPEHYASAYAALLEGDTPLPRDPEPRHPWLADWFRRLDADRITVEETRRVRAAYAGLVARLDELVGRIVAAARALSGETILVYLSDHGEMAGDRGMFWKQSFFEGAVRVPLIIHPLAGAFAAIARGREVRVPVSLVDLAPTLATLGGAPPLPNPDGNDLTPLLRASAGTTTTDAWEERPVFAELVVAGVPVRLIRQGRYKLIYYHGYPSPQLFDLATDPHERHDLGRDDEYAAVRAALEAHVLADWHPDELAHQAREQAADLRYLTRWGDEVGMGPLDLWTATDGGVGPGSR
jgi:choline-sulfatase